MKKLRNAIVHFMKVAYLVCVVIHTTTVIAQANSSHTKVLEQKVTVSFQHVPLSEALAILTKKTGLDFVYSRDFIPQNEEVNGNFKNVTLRNVLKELFVPHNISGRLINDQIVLRRNVMGEERVVSRLADGTVVGQVIDELTQQTLPGASIRVKGTNIGGVTDIKGNCRIDNVAEGTVTLECSYIGYETMEKTVEVMPNGTTPVSFALVMDITGLKEVVITGNLEGQSRALNQQKTADNIKNVISADLIGRFPDLNVSEALQRVPGINIDRDNGEGGAVTIRGTPTNYTSIQVNGEQLPGNGLEGDRSPSLTLYPVDQLASIEVTKSITPDMDGDAIGGVVNMLPPTAKRLAPNIKAELGGGYNNLSKGVNGIGRFSYGQRYFSSSTVNEGKFGALFSGSFFRTDNGEDRTESQWETNDFGDGSRQWYLRRHDLRALQTQRTRAGVGINLDYKFNPINYLQFNFMYNYLEEDEIRTRTRFRVDDGNLESPTESSGSRARKTYRDRVVKRDNFNYTLLGSFDLGGFKMEPGLFFTHTKRDENAIRGEFQARDVDLVIENENTNFPLISSTNKRLDDATIYTEWRNYRPNTRLNETQNFVAKLNLTKSIQIGSINGIIKGGYKYRRTESKKNNNWRIYEYNGDREDLFPRFADYNAVSSEFLNNEVDFGPGFNTSEVDRFFEANSSDFERQTDDEVEENALNFFDANETTHAGYLMGKFNINDRLMLLAGVRYENISVDYDAYRFINPAEPGAPNTFVPAQGSSDYDFFLPNFQARYSINRFTNLRAAITRSFARADFGDIVPSQDVDINAGRIRAGNPDLLPPVAWNYDLKFERYLGNIGIVSLSLFYKSIDDFHFENTYTVDSLVNTEFPSSYHGFRVDQPDNGEEAKVWGIETNIQTNLNFLPGLLSGFGLYLNYTFTNSDAFTADREDIRLPGQADHTGNLAVTYDLKGFSARISLNYQDDLIEALGPNDDGPGQQDVIRDSRYQIDINASQKINDRWRVYTEFINISNQPQLLYFGSPDRIFDVGYFSWWCRFGVSFTL